MPIDREKAAQRFREMVSSGEELDSGALAGFAKESEGPVGRKVGVGHAPLCVECGTELTEFDASLPGSGGAYGCLVCLKRMRQVPLDISLVASLRKVFDKALESWGDQQAMPDETSILNMRCDWMDAVASHFDSRQCVTCGGDGFLPLPGTLGEVPCEACWDRAKSLGIPLMSYVWWSRPRAPLFGR